MDEPVSRVGLRDDPAEVRRIGVGYRVGELGSILQIQSIQAEFERIPLTEPEVFLDVGIPLIGHVSPHAIDPVGENQPMKGGRPFGGATLEVGGVEPGVQRPWPAGNVVQISVVEQIAKRRERSGLEFVANARLPSAEDVVQEPCLPESSTPPEWELEKPGGGEPVRANIP